MRSLCFFNLVVPLDFSFVVLTRTIQIDFGSSVTKIEFDLIIITKKMIFC